MTKTWSRHKVSKCCWKNGANRLAFYNKHSIWEAQGNEVCLYCKTVLKKPSLSFVKSITVEESESAWQSRRGRTIQASYLETSSQCNHQLVFILQNQNPMYKSNSNKGEMFKNASPWEFPCGTAGEGSGTLMAVAQVTAVVQVWSLAQEHTQATGTARKTNKKKPLLDRREDSFHVCFL